MERATQAIEQTAAHALAQDPLWFQDAVIYELLELLRTAGDDGPDLQASVDGLLGLWQAARESPR
jgi:hypothetical protein